MVTRTIRPVVIALTLLGGTGCATFDDGPSAPPAGVFSAEGGLPSVGTRWVVKETSFNRDTRKTEANDLTWTVLSEGMHEGKPVLRLWDGRQVHLHDRATGSWMAVLDRNAREELAYTPHEGGMSTPLWVGKQWTAQSTFHHRLRNTSYHNVVVIWKVVAFEEVKVPGGAWKAFKIEAWPDNRAVIRKRTYWYAPELKVVVKEAAEGYGSPRNIGAGRDWIVYTTELVSYTTPTASMPILVAAVRAPATRLETLWQLGQIGRPGRDALPAVIEVLRTDTNPVHRVAAATTARAIGVSETDVPLLIPALGDGSLEIRVIVADALKANAPTVLELLRKDLGDPDTDKRHLAAQALGGAGRMAPGEVLPLLIAALDDADGRVRVATVRALPNVGAASMPAYRVALRHADAGVRVTAVETMLSAQVGHTAVIEALTGLLGDPDAAVRAKAVGVLGSLGSLSRGSADAIKRLAAGDPSAEVRAAAVRALEDIGPQ